MTQGLPPHRQHIFSISEAARFLGISIDTLRNWEKSGKLTPQRTQSGNRRYRLEQLKRVLEEKFPHLKLEASEPSLTLPAEVFIPRPKIFSDNHILVVKNAKKNINIDLEKIKNLPALVPSQALAATKVFVAGTCLAITLTGTIVGGYLFAPEKTLDLLYPSPESQVSSLEFRVPSPQSPVLGTSAESPNLLAQIKEWFTVILSPLRGAAERIMLTFFPDKAEQIGLEDIKREQEIVKNEIIDRSNTVLANYLKTSGGTVNGKVTFEELVHFTNNLHVAEPGHEDNKEGVALYSSGNIQASGSLTIGGNTIIGSNGKLSGLTGSFIEDLDGSEITKVNADHLDGIDSGSFVRKDQAQSVEGAITFTSKPGSVNISGGPVYINPAASSSDYTLFGIAVNGTQKFKVDTEGDTVTAGNSTVEGTLSVSNITTLSSTLAVGGNTTLTGDLAVNGGDITSTGTSFNLLNSTVTALNIGGAGTTISLGASSGTTTINNALTVTGDTTLTGDLAVNGGDITTSGTTATLFNTNATTLSLGGAATTALNLGNGSGNYTAINLGSGSGTHTINIAGTGAIGADTINIGTGGTLADVIHIGDGATANTISIGSSSSTTVSITDDNWSITTAGLITTADDVAVNGGDLTTTATTFNLANTTATTINFASAATTLNLADAAITGTIDIGGVTANGASTINIATEGTSADVITIGNSHASTTLALTGGDDWSLTTTGILTLSASADQTTALLITDTNYTNALSIADNIILGTTAAIDFSEFDVSASTGAITINDASDAGNISIEGTVLDINSLDFAAAGSITSTGSNDLTFDSGSGTINIALGDDILAVGANSNIGSSGVKFNTIYVDTVSATTLIGTVSGGVTDAADWVINNDNASADTENMSLTFERGSVTPNALLAWDSTNDEFDVNSSINLTGSTSLTTTPLLAIATGTAHTTGDIFDLTATYTPTAGGTQSAIDINLTNSPSTNANTLRGLDISFTDAGSLANTIYGIYVDATTANASDTTYAAALLNGNVGIGTATPAYKLDIATSTASDRGVNIANTAATGTNYGVYSSVTGAATANIGGYFVATGATTSRGLEVAALTSATSTGLTIGALSGTTANTGVSIGAISGTGATGTGITVGNISTTGTTNYGLQLGTMTGGTTSNYQISTGVLTSATTTTNAQLNLGGVVTTGGTTNYGINVGALSGTGTTNYGINIAASTATGTTNYGMKIGAISGAASGTNYGLYVDTVSGAATNYAAIFAGGNVGIGTATPGIAQADIFSGTTPRAVSVSHSGTNIGPTIELANNKDSNGALLGALSIVNDANAGSGSGSSFTKTVSYIAGLQEGSGNNSGGALALYTKTDGGSLTQTMKLDGSGQLTLPATGTSAGIVLGATNTVTLQDDPTVAERAGTARRSYTINLPPEYPGAVMTTFYGGGTDTNVTGDMTSDAETSSSNNLRTYYQWERTTDSTQHFYTVAVRVKLPDDFSAWQTSNALQIDYVTEGTTASEDDLDVYVYLESNSTTAVASNTSLTLSTSWQTVAVDDSTLDDGSAPEWDDAGEVGIIYLRMGSGNSKYVRVGDIKLNYLSKFR
ncbi:MAG: hypothetical protein A2700_01995 [Candidatus Blackburnbacteria bacterium RIFCSPHIGHO2_01_FULL_44_64]|uniref:HTH merR-type domain-containing protein n=1 Tax=Candidatus Blackburnbacteria bacterium RIFCSPHIGHO2_02_FULL_44_20 TaxID=1797516 RepID=A0A1G1V4Y4_9BACT|nr:MAG: hypothetical protein A2700_01995 [Candidatus Blackburnbacteria bacterium RIFCSPHIGHO2_01_FULL_44_64]OGY10435.1 MAG: hypothetical protein A3D26_01365 [Candidatus Blackburnbacteria bacterium RIFCSPHIGHO2_02_FULL_44_20]OGY10477.1 MAG: hypothetical protein A3E16_04270 [Candidatus Blackburnbacteria bacterium RIFCSPHIGHO2_12_FULL_44_25]OGY15110.1 MAG: hypothetical protein A3A62_00195 [Candidatus Blackburnbacteria bacterium RIFCSPLOWO2_01_FULL_44_43]